MSQKKALITALLTGAGILGISTIACAEVPGFYAGALVGYGTQYLSNPNITPALESNLNPVSSTTSSNTKNGFSGGIYGGYQFNDYFGAELGYLFIPTAKFNNSATGNEVSDSTTTGNSTVINSSISSKEDAIDLMLKGMVPFGYGVGGYAKIGYAYVLNKDEISLNSISTNPTATTFTSMSGNTTNNQFKPIGALGLTYDINDNAVVDLSYTYLFGSSGSNSSSNNYINTLNNTGKVNINAPKASVFSVGITYYFTGGGTDDP